MTVWHKKLHFLTIILYLVFLSIANVMMLQLW